MIDKKDFKILFLYPNQHMRVTPPGGIAIISACLKREGFTNLHLFDSTWFPYAEQKDAMSGEQADRDKERAKRGMFKEYKWGEDFQVEDVNMYDAWRDMVLEVQPDVIISSIVEDTYSIWKKMIAMVDDQKFISVVGGVFPTSVPTSDYFWSILLPIV
jgi:anaerobic magnesium-protoporphyrin IX monomethyl ester cyclase